MRRILLIAICVLAVGTTQCSKQPKPKPVAVPQSESLKLAEQLKELAFDFPPEALDRLYEPEVSAYANALPALVVALKAAHFRPPYLEGARPREVFAQMGWLADTMRAAPGFDSALARYGLTARSFRATFLKVWAAGYAIALDSSIAAFKSRGGEAQPDGKRTLMLFQPRIDACAKIPPENIGLVRKYRDQLDILKQLL